MLRVPPGARGLLVLLLLPLLGAQGGPCEQEEIANGRMYVTYGSVRRAAFYCNEGYTLSGPASVQCVRKWGSFWDKELPSCQAILCPPPPVVANGSHDHQDEQFPVGSAVAYRCDPGFSLVGEASINCTRKDGFSGEWSGPAPECKVQCPKPEVQNGNMINELDDKMWYNVNETISFKCSPGYQLSSHPHLPAADKFNTTCSADGNWTATPQCKKKDVSGVCEMVSESRELLQCGVPLEHLKALLEVQKLYLETEKLMQELKSN